MKNHSRSAGLNGPWMAPGLRMLTGRFSASNSLPLHRGLQRGVRLLVVVDRLVRLPQRDRVVGKVLRPGHDVEVAPVRAGVDAAGRDDDHRADVAVELPELVGVPRLVRDRVEHQVVPARLVEQRIRVVAVEADGGHVEVGEGRVPRVLTAVGDQHRPAVVREPPRGGGTDLAGAPDDHRRARRVRCHVINLRSRRCDQEDGSDLFEAAGEVGVELVDRDALLLHRVAVAHGHGVVLERVEVDGDAERRADLVLAAVATADRPRVVEVDVRRLRSRVGQRAGERSERLVA